MSFQNDGFVVITFKCYNFWIIHIKLWIDIDLFNYNVYVQYIKAYFRYVDDILIAFKDSLTNKRDIPVWNI